METRSTRSLSRSQIVINLESPGNSSSDERQPPTESSSPTTPKDKVSRKRKVDSSSPEDETFADSEFESSSTSAHKHCRRAPHDPDCPPLDWQSTKQTLKDRAAYAFNNELFCDVNFIVGQGVLTKKIPAHKFILSIGSSVFDAMFNGAWSETNVIEVPEIDPTVFHALLRYLYTDEVLITADTVMALLYAAKKYAIPHLHTKCLDYLLSHLNPQNAFTILSQARSFDEQDLVTSCLEKIDTNAVEAFSSDCFTEIDIETLCLVLERSVIEIREILLFEAVCRWCKAELTRQNLPNNLENQQLVLARVLPLIRYPLMTAKEVSLTVAPTELLSDKELVSLYKYYSLNPKPPINFVSTPRGPQKRIVVRRFKRLSRSTPWGYMDGIPDAIGFCCDQNIWMEGFGIFGPIDRPLSYKISVRLTDTLTKEVLYEDARTLNKDASIRVYHYPFSHAVKLTAHTNYTLRLLIEGPRSYYGKEGLKEVTMDLEYGGQVTISFNDVNDGFTTVEMGQIPGISFHF